MDYRLNAEVSVDQFADLLHRSTLAGRRPVDDRECLSGMLDQANLAVTAWRANRLVGIARSVTDFSYCCYLSDLAVDQEFQHQGIGRELIRQTRRQLGPRCTIILLAAPGAEGYYPHLGFKSHPSAWILGQQDELV